MRDAPSCIVMYEGGKAGDPSSTIRAEFGREGVQLGEMEWDMGGTRE